MKKKMISMVLALTLVVSGLPATSASATELDTVSAGSIWVPTEETEDVSETAIDESTNVDETVELAAENNNADLSRFNINADGKVLGSDGIAYEDVTYLSVNTVKALDADTQDAYFELCDAASDWIADGAEDVVFAVDENGELRWTFHVPGTVLSEKQQELVEGVLTGETEESSVEETIAEEESSVEETTTEEESSVEETTTEEESSVEETTDEESSVEEITAEESSVEEITAEDSSAEETTVEEESSEEETTAEEESSVEETITEEELTLEAVEEEVVELQAENMDLIPVLENEQVELADAPAVATMDLGYGNSGDGNAATFNVTLSSETYFSGQLSGNAKNIYNVAKDRLISGNTTFTFTGGSNKTLAEDVSDAISAVVLTYPEKTDWFGKTERSGWQVTGGSYNIRTGIIKSCTVAVDKSAYYSSALDSKANAQVEKLATEALAYARKNYSTSPAYGVVEYFDKWICANNYYNTPGGVYGSQGEEVYYYCHSAYGALLAGYAVCESYAKAMSRLLDAVEIPNVYVTGYAFGDPDAGHAWNYVQMPDGKWYLLDSTWNDPSDNNKPSTKDFLLAAGDADHTPTGQEYMNMKKKFSFPKLASTKYAPATEAVAFEQGTSLDMIPKASVKLTTKNTELNSSYKVWSSSNTSVAKVDSNGKVTAVAPGTAVIKLSTTVAGNIELKAECTINVYQVKALTSSRTGKTSDSISMSTGNAATIVLDANVTNSPYTAQQMVGKVFKNGKTPVMYTTPVVTSSKPDVATAEATLTGNQISVKITPVAAGSTNVKVAFGGKAVTIKASVGETISESMFNIDWAGAKVENKAIAYTGKAVRPKVTKADSAPSDLKFKVTYLNNTNAGIASVKISGTGKYGGEIEYKFTITPINISAATISTIKAKTYNGGENPASATVKLGNKKLVANKDYVLKYNGNTSTDLNAGTYTVTVEGKGNYTGTATATASYVVNQNTIAKVTASCASTVKYTGGKQYPVTVKIGKNVLPASDYTVTYYKGTDTKDRTQKVSAPSVRGSYFAVITVKGSNITNTAAKTEIVKKFKVK